MNTAPGNTSAYGDQTDADLVRRAKEGDERAFESLFGRHSKRIFSIAYGMLRNEADAADATQEAFVRAYRSLVRLEAEGAFGGWLAQIVVNICRDILKRPRVIARSLDEPVESEDSEYRLEVADDGVGPERASLDRELKQVLRKAIGSLTPDHQAVITMHHLEGIDVLDIAEAMGVSEGTIKSRLSRARAELRRKLGYYINLNV